jgi:hypothetical protein
LISSHFLLGVGLGGAPPDRRAGAMRDRFARFLRRFRGPATRHLAGYLVWFGAWAAGGRAVSPPPRPAACATRKADIA